jgi:SAM-dependent methyltransferase
MTTQVPDYKNLDLSGEALAAAQRMEARAAAPASLDMFQYLIAPLLTPQVTNILEYGCGTAVLSRRMAQAAPQTYIYACDKSQGMLDFAQQMLEKENIANVHLDPWDILDESTFPYPSTPFHLIISSVVVPYLDDEETSSLVKRLCTHLVPGGILAFIEQDWQSDIINYPDLTLLRRILRKEVRSAKRTQALGLRPVLREAGLQLLPRRAFLWTEPSYGPYTHELLERFALAAQDHGDISARENEEWKQTLEALSQNGDFFYAILYHLIAGQKIAD